MSDSKALKKMLADIGIHLARLREKKGYTTIREFAQKYDLPEIQYWRMEKGKANITLKSLMKILTIHKITLEDFFCEVTAQKKLAA
jgi:transcriptional regulator with XRE-family HTH domain